MKRYDELNNKGKRNLEEFLTITFEFTDEQLAAIDYQIPMTQEIYDSILDRCMVLGSSVDNLFYRLLVEYPDFMTVYANRIEQEVEGKYSDIVFQSLRQKSCRLDGKTFVGVFVNGMGRTQYKKTGFLIGASLYF